MPLDTHADEVITGVVGAARAIGDGRVAHFGLSFGGNFAAASGLTGLVAPPGAVTLGLRNHHDLGAVEVRVTDHVRWSPPPAVAPRSTRGRGTMLMKALADQCAIHGTSEGTVVNLLFTTCLTHTSADQ